MRLPEGANPVAVIVSANVRRRQLIPGQVAMAAAIGLVEQGLRKKGRWVRGSLDIGSAADIAARTINQAGVILDYDHDRGTTFADRVLTGGTPLNEAYQTVMRARGVWSAGHLPQRGLPARSSRLLFP